MRRITPIAWLMILTSCAGQPAPTPPPVAEPAPAGVAAPTARRAPPVSHAAPERGYQQEVDELLNSLAGTNAPAGQTVGRIAPASVPAPSPMPSQVPTPQPSAEPLEVNYEENLATCLDGRFPAFCDHHRLTTEDATQVDAAERKANEITCIDPQWEHLCRPELLPEYPELGQPPKPTPTTASPPPQPTSEVTPTYRPAPAPQPAAFRKTPPQGLGPTGSLFEAVVFRSLPLRAATPKPPPVIGRSVKAGFMA
jgi:hypothetical protein